MTVNYQASQWPGQLPGGLAAHEATVRRDLGLLMLPAADWTVPRQAPDGAAMLDVIVIGGGMYGVAAAGGLLMKGIRNIRVLDRAPRGQEGPWVTYARMPTLRSPKTLTGPCFGVPSLTFHAWYEAKYGAEAWEALYKIPNAIWQDYLIWVRDMLGVPVTSGAKVVDLRPRGDHVAVACADGTTLCAKRVVVATGRSAIGGWNLPGTVDAGLWPDLAAHTSEAIDFAALRGKRIAVLGAGASAWDNAATALEAGAASAEMFCRRAALPQVNKGRAVTSPGYFEGWMGLTDDRKWALAAYLDDMQSPPPHETVFRTHACPGFKAHFGCGVTSARRAGDAVRIETAAGISGLYDFMILGTGFRIDLAEEPVFAGLSERIKVWSDAYAPPPGLERPHLGRQPWIGASFELVDRRGAENTLGRIHMFNAATFVSVGALAADVPSLDAASTRLGGALAQALFGDDFTSIFEQLEAWDAEHELAETPYYAPDHVNWRGR